MGRRGAGVQWVLMAFLTTKLGFIIGSYNMRITVKIAVTLKAKIFNSNEIQEVQQLLKDIDIINTYKIRILLIWH